MTESYEIHMLNMENTVRMLESNLVFKPIYGGSFGLMLNGLLDRRINDIDIITDKDYYGRSDHMFNDISQISLSTKPSSGKFVVGNNLVKSTKFDFINGIPADFLFIVNDGSPIRIEYNEIEWKGMKLHVEDPQSAVQAKYQYQGRPELFDEAKEKHRTDLINMPVTISRLEYEELKYYKEKYRSLSRIVHRRTEFDHDDLPF